MTGTMNTRTFNAGEISAGRILSMLQVMEPDEVAAELGVQWSKLRTILEREGQALPRYRWAGMNLKTGAIIRSYTERGVYLQAQIRGWTDWCYVDPVNPVQTT